MRPFIALLCCVAAPALAAPVTGELTLPEGATFPAGAELHIMATAADGQPAGQLRQPMSPGDPPGFALPVTATTGVILQAAVYAGARPLWLSDALVLPDAPAPVTLPLFPAVLPAGLAPYACGERRLSVALAPATARLVEGWTETRLQPDPATEGRFADPATDTSLRVTGNRLAVTMGGEALPPCQPLMPQPLFPLAAAGTDPVWSLLATREAMALAFADGATAVGQAPDARATPEGLVIFAAPDMNLFLTEAPCADAGTAAPFPLAASLQRPGTTLTGCAGHPAQALEGAWTITAIAGAPAPEGATLTFAPGRVTAFAGCNRLTAPAAIGADGALTAGPVAATRMACPAALQAAEDALAAALPRARRATLNPAAGRIDLMDGTAAVLSLTRPLPLR